MSLPVCLTTKLDQRNGYRPMDITYHDGRRWLCQKLKKFTNTRAGFWAQSKFYEVLCARSVKSKNAIHFSFIAYGIFFKIIQYMRENPEKLAAIYQKIADLIFSLKILLKIRLFQPKLAS